MLFIYLYHSDLYSDLWNCDLYFSPAAVGQRITWNQLFLCFFLYAILNWERSISPECVSECIGDLLAGNVYNLGNFYSFFFCLFIHFLKLKWIISKNKAIHSASGHFHRLKPTSTTKLQNSNFQPRFQTLTLRAFLFEKHVINATKGYKLNRCLLNE